VLIPVHWGTLHPMLLRRFMDPVWRDTLDRLLASAVGDEELETRVLDPGVTTSFVRTRDIRDDDDSGS
jgi:hypothetical protein